MHWGFFSLLVVGTVSGYAYSRYENELTSLFGAIAVISYLISLIIAPLFIHLLLLLTVFIVTKKLLWINTCKLNQNDSFGPNAIELSDSGQSHQPQQTRFEEQISSPAISTGSIATARISHLFKYRGASFFHQAFSNQTHQIFPTQELNSSSQHHSGGGAKVIGKYRGSIILGK